MTVIDQQAPSAATARPARRSPLSSGWPRLVLRRLVFVPVTLWLVATITFFVTRLLGGNPAVKLAGPQPTPESIAGIEQQLGLDRPLLEQYVGFLSGLVRLDFGQSFMTRQPVLDEIVSRTPGTLELVAIGTGIATVLGVLLAMIAVRRPGSVVDRICKSASVVAFATPDFFLGGVLALVFAFSLGWLPAPSGQLPFSVNRPVEVTHSLFVDSVLNSNAPAFLAHLQLLVLPCLTLGLVYFASIFKVTRGALEEIQRSEFMQYADAMGLSPGLRRRYALRHAMTLVVTYVGSTTATLLGGAVLVEQVFSWGGLGTYGVDAIQNNDYPAVQGFVVVVGAMAVLVYFVVDLLYGVIDPRVRL